MNTPAEIFWRRHNELESRVNLVVEDVGDSEDGTVAGHHLDNAKNHLALSAFFAHNDDLGGAYNSLSTCERSYGAALAKLNEPTVERDHARQVGTQKKRRSRMPALDAWLDEMLATTSDICNDLIWRALPDERNDFQRVGLYRDGEKVIEYHDEQERETGRDGFDKRVTAARKRARNAVSN